MTARTLAGNILTLWMMRPDVLPADDTGLHRAMALHYNNGKHRAYLLLVALQTIPL